MCGAFAKNSPLNPFGFSGLIFFWLPVLSVQNIYGFVRVSPG